MGLNPAGNAAGRRGARAARVPLLHGSSAFHSAPQHRRYREAVAHGLSFLCTLLLAVGPVGCGGADNSGDEPSPPAESAAPAENDAADSGFPELGSAYQNEPGDDTAETDVALPEPDVAADDPDRDPRSSLADLMEREGSTDPLDELKNNPYVGPQVDDAKIAAAGIRKLAGRQVTIYTDLPASEAVDELPAVFDLAVPQWADYFGIDADRAARFKMFGYVVKDKQLFTDVGLLPESLPPFLHGYQRGFEFWVYDQPSDYFRRHLVIHEGTHGFMNILLGGTGPPWYMEGTAELFGTHRWADGKLTLRYFPRDKKETPYWGRIKIIKEDFAAGKGMILDQVMNYGPRAHLEVGPYAWCWGAAALLDTHPEFHERFLKLKDDVRDDSFGFSQKFGEAIGSDREKLNEAWQLFVAELEYGYDVARAAVVYKPAAPLPAEGAEVSIAADRGWQSTGLQLAAPGNYEIRASGRYQVGNDPKAWWCEPQGVTIHYYRDRPLGMLMAAVRQEPPVPETLTPLLAPTPIGRRTTIKVVAGGTLFLRINESAAGLADNAGTLRVRIVRK